MWSSSDINYAYVFIQASGNKLVADNTIPLKINRRLCVLQQHSSVTWPDPFNVFLPKVARRMFHKLCEISKRFEQPCGGHFGKELIREMHPPSPTARAMVKSWRSSKLM